MSSPNYINILASNCFLDVSGTPIAKGTLTVTSVDANGDPTPFLVGGGGLVTVLSVIRTIVNGSITAPLQLANPATADISVGYTFEVCDSATFEVVTFPSVAVVADDSGNFDLSGLSVGSYATAVPVAYVAGPAGPKGDKGDPGDSGTGSGTPGAKGDPGLSAYQIAVNDGFIGTEQQWLVSLVGAPGAKGDKGDTGDQGLQGIQGVKGDTGDTGLQGVKGDAGATGATGTPATPNSATAPILISGNVISIPAATNSVNGYLTAADHSTFAAKQATLGFTPLNPANNLSEVTATAARTNLGLATVASSGSYADLSGKPTIPAAQVNSDWTAVSGVAAILNKPTFAAIATSGLTLTTTGSGALCSRGLQSGSVRTTPSQPRLRSPLPSLLRSCPQRRSVRSETASPRCSIRTGRRP